MKPLPGTTTPKVKPCPSYFIKGACRNGDKCKMHHVGTAAAFKPK